MTEKDKQTLRIRFNATHYIAKNECPYSQFGNLLILEEKVLVLQTKTSFIF